MKLARNIFLAAGIYGFLVLTPLFFLEDRIGRDTPPPITHPECFYGFLCVALVFQVVFLIIATDPVRFRPMMIPSILEKASWGITLVALLAQRRIAFSLFAIGSVDWIFAFLFIFALAKTPPPSSDKLSGARVV